MSKLIIDMMGSDLGSDSTKEGVRLYHKEHPETELVLVGDEKELADMKDYRLIPSSSIVKMEMGALEVMREKDSSLVKAVKAVLSEDADGVVSAGSTGAFLSAATLLLKKVPGVDRPALVTSVPNLAEGGFTTLLDVGASNVNTALQLHQFAVMGNLYAQFVYGLAKPRVKLLSNGSEEGKGSPEGKDAYVLLKNDPSIFFQGNIEANNVLNGLADVVVTDGYSGNILLKSLEGSAHAFGMLLKKTFKHSFWSRLAYLQVRKQFNDFKVRMDPRKTGGALLIGVNEVVVKAHGNSDGEAFYHAIALADKLAQAHFVDALKKGLDHE
jgi:phosphate acyltransferase